MYKYPCSTLSEFLEHNPLNLCYDPADDDNAIVLTAKVNFIDMPTDRCRSFLFFVEYDAKLETDFLECKTLQDEDFEALIGKEHYLDRYKRSKIAKLRA